MKSSVKKKRARGGARPGAGKPAFEPTDQHRNKIMVMMAAGFDQHAIAKSIGTGGISDATLRKYFKHEIEVGKDQINFMCANGLVKKMQNGDLGALCFWAKTRMRWRENDPDRGAEDRLDELASLIRQGPLRHGPVAVPAPVKTGA